MNFKEQFPSLAYKQKVISFSVEEHDGNRWNDSIHYLSKEVIDLENVKKYTIDKEILKQIINKIFHQEHNIQLNKDSHTDIKGFKEGIELFKLRMLQEIEK